ncbi:MAG: uroporphyrinogen-III synthase [Candidatus Entotheonellia bacterium]
MVNSTEGGDNFDGLQVVAFESRRATDMVRLIAHYGGKPLIAPALREVPLEENSAALAFAARLFAGELDVVVFLTGVGARTLIEVIAGAYPRAEIVEALSRVTVAARGPKPVVVLRELGIPIAVTAPSPHTWRELLQALEEHHASIPLQGRRIAVQEYGLPNAALLASLQARGAHVLSVPVYRWALPHDTDPLHQAVEALVEGQVQVALFTNAVQVTHLMQVAGETGQEEALRQALRRIVVVSVGPTASEALAAHGLTVDLEPTQPKLGPLVKEAAQHSRELLRQKGRLP